MRRPLLAVPAPPALYSLYQSACRGETFSFFSCPPELLTRRVCEPARGWGRRCSVTPVCPLSSPPSGALQAPLAFRLTLHSMSSRAPACHAIAAKPHSGLVLRRSAEFILAEQQVKYLADLCFDSSCSCGVCGRR